MKYLLLFLLLIFAISCATSKSSTSNNNKKESEVSQSINYGLSFENAVILKESNESTGVHAEYSWLKQNYPGYVMKLQSLIFNNKKPYDVIEIVTTAGEGKTIYFDISRFYGKY
jgi:hypothetical protein